MMPDFVNLARCWNCKKGRFEAVYSVGVVKVFSLMRERV